MSPSKNTLVSSLFTDSPGRWSKVGYFSILKMFLCYYSTVDKWVGGYVSNLTTYSQ